MGGCEVRWYVELVVWDLCTETRSGGRCGDGEEGWGVESAWRGGIDIVWMDDVRVSGLRCGRMGKEGRMAWWWGFR